MSGKTMIFLPLRELRRSDVSPDLPPVASHRYWGIMAEQMMAVFSDSTSTKRGYYVDKVRFLVVSSTKCLSLKNVDSQNASKNVYKLLIPQRSILRQSD